MPTTAERRLISLFSRSSGFVRVQLPAVRRRKVQVGEHVLGRLLEQLGGLGEAAAQALDDPLQLRLRRRVVGLREDRPHDRGHRLAGAARQRGQHVAHEVHATPLPRGAAEHRGDARA